MKATLSVLPLVALAFFSVAGPAEAQVGNITFPTSASGEAQEHFVRGVAILHSFGFEDAIDAFQEAQKLDPDFALAYWGEALCYNNNPLVSPTRQDLPAARKALMKLAPTRRERVAKAPTEREKLYMRAVEALYGTGEKQSRDQAYAAIMKELVDEYPEDEEARAFYALALLGTVGRAGDNFDAQMKAAAVAQRIYRDNPDHPGAAHYIIHAFDDPLHAPLALYAAERYAEIAPDVEHALHMPSHIFVQLGLWDEVARSNRRAYDASVEWARRRGLSDTRRDFHALSWLQYAKLQKGEYGEAKATIEEIGPIARRQETTSRIKATLANMTARYLLETEHWGELELPVEELLGERYSGDVFLLLAAGMKAVHQSDLDEAARIEARLEELQDQDTEGLKSYLQGQVTLKDLQLSAGVAHLELAARRALAQGNLEESLRLAEAAVEREAEMHPAYGPPEPIKPPRELYAEILLEAGRPQQAASEFAKMIDRMPNRTQSILGAARSAAKNGDDAGARARYRELLTIWSGDAEVASKSEAERYLSESGGAP